MAVSCADVAYFPCLQEESEEAQRILMCKVCKTQCLVQRYTMQMGNVKQLADAFGDGPSTLLKEAVDLAKEVNKACEEVSGPPPKACKDVSGPPLKACEEAPGNPPTQL